MFWLGTSRSILNKEKEFWVEIFIKELFLKFLTLSCLIETDSDAAPNILMLSLHSKHSISCKLTFDIKTDFKGFEYWAELFHNMKYLFLLVHWEYQNLWIGLAQLSNRKFFEVSVNNIHFLNIARGIIKSN
jgi:hypothetical protein